MSVKFSVIIPVYKVETYLRQCIDSVLNQPYSDLEIILVDDGSPDNCPTICDEYSIKDSRVKVIHKENGGPSSARNVGIKSATGDFIFFLDSDDYLVGDIFTSNAKLIEKYNVDMVLHNYLLYNCVNGHVEQSGINYSRLLSNKFNSSEAIKELLSLYPNFDWYPWQFFVKKSVVMQNSLYFDEGVLYEDVKLIFKLMLNSDSIAFNNEALLNYRVGRNGATTSTKKFNSECDKLNIVKENILWIDSVIKDPELKALLNNNFACMVCAVISSLNFVEKSNRRLLLQKIKQSYSLTRHITSSKQRYVKVLIYIFGIRFTSLMLYMRALLKYKGMLKL